MSIEQLQHTYDVKNKVNEIVDKVNTSVTKISSVSELSSSNLVEGDAVELIGYHEGTTVGGGSGVVKTARHNGGTAISLTRVFPTDWADQVQLTAWFADSGVDELCFIRVSNDIYIEDFGAKGDNFVTDSTKAILKALNTEREVLAGEGRFLFTDEVYSKFSVSPVRPDLLHDEYAGLKFRGAGEQRTIFKCTPTTQIRHGMIFGNYTEEVPTTVYEGAQLDIGSFTVLAGNTNCDILFRARETYDSNVGKIRLGVVAENTLTTTTDFIFCMLDGCINSEYSSIKVDSHESIDKTGIKGIVLRSSARLTTGAGSGNGASPTSSRLTNVYARLCEHNIIDSDSNGCFISGAAESGKYGLFKEGSLVSEYDLYVENNEYPYYINGTGTQTASSAKLKGYINFGSIAGGKRTTDGTTFTKSPSPITAINCSVLDVSGLHVVGEHSINSLVDTQGNVGSLKYPSQFGGSSLAPRSIDDKAVTAYSIISGQNNVKLTCADHDCIVGDIVGIINTTVDTAAGLIIGAPLAYVTYVADDNVLWITASTDVGKLASGTDSGAITASLRKYRSGAGKMPFISSPRNTLLTDCNKETAIFSKYLTTAPSGLLLNLNNTAGADYYETDTWTYIMYANRFASVAPVASVANYVYVQVKYPSEYSQEVVNFDTGNLQGSRTSKIADIGYLVPPGTKIYAQITSGSFISGGGVNERAETINVYLQKIPNYLESF